MSKSSKEKRQRKKAGMPPEPVRPVAELASFRRRLASMLYELLLLIGVFAFAVMLPVIIVGTIWGDSSKPPEPDPLLGSLMWIYIFTVIGCYFVGFWRKRGQTLAMQTWKLMLVDAGDGRHLSIRRCWLRYALCWPSVFLFGVGILWALFDRDRQFLHDRLVKSCIVLIPTSK